MLSILYLINLDLNIFVPNTLTKKLSTNILKHESDIWSTADLLRGAGFKNSDFPKFMMPFFAARSDGETKTP